MKLKPDVVRLNTARGEMDDRRYDTMAEMALHAKIVGLRRISEIQG